MTQIAKLEKELAAWKRRGVKDCSGLEALIERLYTQLAERTVRG